MQWYAYFAPHTHEQHLQLLAECQLSEGVSVRRLGATVDGRDLHSLSVGEGPLQFWIIGRQHPGESMASWWMEGFLANLPRMPSLMISIRRLVAMASSPATAR